jgi:PEP-CTERM motif-containing protein
VIDQSTGWIALDVTVSSQSLDVSVSRQGIDVSASLYSLDVNKAVPEPSTWALVVTGFLGLGGLEMRRRKQLFAA